LSKALAKVRVLWAGLELNQREIAAISHEDEIHSTRVEKRLSPNDKRRPC
jgi:hypothetical protein